MVSGANEAAPEAGQRKLIRLGNMAQRGITIVVMLPLIVFLTFMGSWWMFAGVLFLVVVGLLEFYHMEAHRYSMAGNALIGLATGMAVLLAFQLQVAWLGWLALLCGALVTLGVELLRRAPFQQARVRVLTTMGGVLYLALPFGCMLAIRAMWPFGLNWLYAVFFATWGTDVLAFIVGRALGRTPLAPHISPKKTLEGAVGGIFGGAFITSLVLLQIEALSLASFLLVLALPFAAIAGDLFESMLKRYFGIKDSYIPHFNIFPGHGGVLDRVDSLVVVALCVYAFLLLNGQVGF